MILQNRNFYLILISGTLICLFSCVKSSQPNNPSNPGGPAITGITITSLTPAHGPYNTIDTITGKGFDLIPSFDSIIINGKKLNIISHNSEQIIVQIPLLTGTGKVDVWYQGKMTTGPVFTYDSVLMVTTIAGNSQEAEVNGHGLDARFWNPIGIAVDHTGNLYVAEMGGSCIRKIDTGLNVTTLAGPAAPEAGYVNGTGSVARFASPSGLCIDQNGFLYVADVNNTLVRKVSPAGVVTTFAGKVYDTNPNFGGYDGDTATATFNTPYGVACDKNGNIFVADTYNNKIRKITQAGVVSSIAGADYYHFGSTDGKGSAALFYEPDAIAVDYLGNIFTLDNENHILRKTAPDGMVTTLLGPMEVPYITGPYDDFFAYQLATDKYGNLYFGINVGIIKMSPDGTLNRYATGGIGEVDGPAQIASYRAITGITVDDAGTIFITDNNRIRKIAWQ